jgi:formylglycine-generating enzyme required for sulfatase activity
MKRLIEIEDDTLNEEKLRIETDDLPIKITYVYKHNNNKILIEKIDKETEYDGYQAIVCAYISQDDGHLFFQINKEQIDKENINIFHNNEKVEKSVWLKSGDIIKISNKLIHYYVMGDIIKINVSDETTASVTDDIVNKIQSPIDSPDNNEKNNNLPRVEVPAFDNSISKKSKIKKISFFSLSILLVFISFFILQAEIVTIKIEPKVDTLEIKGIFPIVAIAQRYMIIRGDYEIIATKKDYKPINKKISVDENNKDFSYKMIELPGILEINIDSDGNDSIKMDGILMLSTAKNSVSTKAIKNEIRNNNRYEIEKGIHLLTISNPRYQDYEQKINIAGKNKLQKLVIKLIPNWGMLKLTSHTKDIKVEISTENSIKENINFSLNKEKEIELIANDYIITISKEKYKSVIKTISIIALEDKALAIEALIPEDGELSINSQPEGSIIRIDGIYKGKTPQTYKLKPNYEHKIELSLSGYQSLKTSIRLEPEEIKTINPLLGIKKGLVFVSITPTNAKLIIDGKVRKKNSGKFVLNAKEHHFVVKAEGYKSQTKYIKGSDYSQNISFNLKKIREIKNKSEVSKSKVNNKPFRNKNYYINSIKQTMLLIKPAQFTMGSKNNEAGRGSNEREYKVKLDYAYYLSKKEISNKQFKTYQSSHDSGNATKSLALDNQPVVNVSWNDAAKFANWLSKKEGLEAFYEEVNGKMKAIDRHKKITGYRLPFEAEWAYAARGSKQQKYPWLGDFPPVNMVGNFADESARALVSNIIEGYNDQYAVSSPIGHYKKNTQGFYDLGGNVSEWCQDYYSPLISSANSKKTIINPKGPTKGTHRVVRDSSWRDSSIRELRLSYRSYSKKKANDIGFRLARYAQ